MNEQTSIEDKQFFDGFPISADEIVKMENKEFEVLHATKELLEDYKDKSKVVEKTKLKIALSDGACVDYYPNVTSIRQIVNLFGRDLSKWEHSKWQFEVKPIEFGSLKGQNSLYIKPIVKESMPKKPTPVTK